MSLTHHRDHYGWKHISLAPEQQVNAYLMTLPLLDSHPALSYQLLQFDGKEASH